jgi:uncharacterized protein YndB with AHSA1/START domain
MKPKLKTTTITLNRTIPAAPAEVYDAWLDPEKPGTPWHGADKLILDPKVDGLFYFNSISPEGVDRPHFGRFTALSRATKVEYTWMSPFTHGLETVVTVELEPKGQDTLLQLRHANVPDDELGRVHEGGWAYFLGLLAERLGARRAS